MPSTNWMEVVFLDNRNSCFSYRFSCKNPRPKICGDHVLAMAASHGVLFFRLSLGRVTLPSGSLTLNIAIENGN